jgi:hypothetical protein
MIAFQAAVVAALWVTFLLKLLPVYRVDSFRQKMFAVRDELFDFAAAGGISFDDPAYLLLRQQMNGMIRYGHQITVFRTLITMGMRYVRNDVQREPWTKKWEASLRELNDDKVRDKMQMFHNKGATIAAKHLIIGSPILWLAILISATIMMAHGAALGTRQLIKAAAERVLTGPLNQRIIEEAAMGALAC